MEQRMIELIELLNKASDAYYNGDEEIMSNFEWDAAFDELTRLEQEMGVVLENSPTRKVGAETDKKEKVTHEFPALSLPKTKSAEALRTWLTERKTNEIGWLSWKLDGLTLVATYDKGKLKRLVKRGNGIVGEDVTKKAKYISNLPMKIEYKGKLVVRGEAIISYADFERINAEIADEAEKYKNPRNLASGTVGIDIERAKEIKERGLKFIAFTYVYSDTKSSSWSKNMEELKSLGFDIVPYQLIDADNIQAAIDEYTEKVKDYEFPVDGLVLVYEDEEYAASGTVTEHHVNRAGIAFKWKDKPVESTLKRIEWSCGNYYITPVAVFEPIEIEGTTVQRASLCNISEIKRLGLGADNETKLQVIKANMIIPKIVAATRLTDAECIIPTTCPICGAPTEIIVSHNNHADSEFLRCTNEDCSAKQLKKYERFVSKKGMDIDGISLATIKDFVEARFINNPADFFHLDKWEETITVMNGYGEKSFKNIMKAIEKAKNTTFAQFIYALSIPMVGEGQAKSLEKAYKGSVKDFLNDMFIGKDFSYIEGIGEKINESIQLFAAKHMRPTPAAWIMDLYKICNFKEYQETGNKLEGLTFVITGDVHIFKNRDEFKAYVTANGGKVAGSVSKKTSYLVNNDTESTSSKNQKAKELGIEIISEDTFVEKFGK